MAKFPRKTIALHRKERKGDRSRARIAMPREQVMPTFNDGMVTVEVAHESSIRRLKRLGFVPVSARLKAAVPTPSDVVVPVAVAKPIPTDSAPALVDLGMDALKAMAKAQKVKGRSKMDRQALIDALS